MIAIGKKQASEGAGAEAGADERGEAKSRERQRGVVVMYWTVECRSEATVTRRTQRNGEMSLAHLSACG